MKLIKGVLVVLVCTVMAALPLMVPSSSHAQAPGLNLLVDGNFEAPPTWPMQDGIGEVQVAPGWRAWYLDVDQVPSYVQMPVNCKNPKSTDCYWMRPEFRDNVAASFANRVHGGVRSQKYFSYGRMHEAGLYQRVGGITPGVTLRFSIYIQAWMCYEIDKCGKNGIRSDAPSDMHLRVGIDPYGGTNPFSSNIVWAPEQEAFDRWVEFSVEAKAQADAVTVFTHSRPEWGWARNNNDVYLDDASLVVIGPEPGQTTTLTSQPGAMPAATQPAGTPAPTNTPLPTPTPRPDGAIVHVVQAGDTLFGISLQYDVPLDDLLKINNLTNVSILNVGQEIVVKVGQGTVIAPAATTGPRATPTISATVAPTVAPSTLTPPPPTATPVQGGLCMSAFEDVNNNGLRDGNEAGLAGVTFVISSGGSEVARYATDGSLPPYCLTALPPGAYSVQVALPPGYVATFDKTDVTLTLSQRVDLSLAVRRGEKATLTPAPTSQAQSTTAAPARSNTTLIAVIVFAGLFAVLIGLAIVIIRRGR